MARIPPLTTAGDFQRVYRKGGRAFQDFLQVRHLATSRPVTRLGIVTRSAIFKRAVRRNRLRRLLRESFRHLEPPLAPGFDIVLIPQREPEIDHQAFIDAVLTRALRKAGLYSGPLAPFPKARAT